MTRFYHVDFRGELKAGDLLTCLPVTSAKFPEDAAYLNEHFPEGLSYFGSSMVLHTDSDHPEARIEQILETIRRSFQEKCGVNYPSRLSCLFATDGFETARAFRTKWQRESGRIWIVECEDFFRGDMNLVCPSLIENHDLAVYYWQGRSTDNPFWEYLLRLPVRVVEQVDGPSPG